MEKPLFQDRLFFDCIQDGVLVVRDQRIELCNPILADMLGTGIDSLIGRSALDIVAPEDREQVGDLHRRRIAGEVVSPQYETRLIHSDGTTRIPVLISVGVVREGPQAGAAIGTIKDLSEIRRSTAENERRRIEIEQILEGLPDTYYRTDAEGKVLYCSQTSMDIFGLPPQDMIGRPLASFYVTPEERAQVVQTILAAKGQYVLVEARVKRADGGISWASTRARALFDAEGKFAGVEGSGRDISKRIYMEQALRESLKQVEAKERAKTRFLAAASHDLRQPIQAINLFLDGLRHTPLSKRQEAISGQLMSAVRSLSDLLDALLDISRLDAGIVEPHPQPVGVEDLLSQVENNCAAGARARQLRFRIWLPITPLSIYTDKALMGAILRNLVTNAIAYTSQGGVLVSVRRRRNEILFQVWDTGCGIDEEHQDRVFEEFYQADNPERDRNKGLGLGLAIVRRMAALLGITVRFRSHPGRGTVFDLRMPEYNPALHGLPAVSGGAGNAPVDSESFRDKRFIVVEDDEQLARSIQVWLEGLGARMARFPSTEAALAMGQLDTADFFIADFRLPGALNGIDFLNEVRRRIGRPIQAVLMTGDTSPDFIAQASSSGWPTLFKPVTPDILLATLMQTPANEASPPC